MTTNLLDRYLHTVRLFLPPAQKNDIIRELSENIRSEMEEKEAELGHPLDETEQVAILKQHGNPLLVAGRYSGERLTLAFGRELIGPELFPIYIRVLLLSLPIPLIVTALTRWAFAVPFVVGPFLLPLVIPFTVVTLIFMIVQQFHEQLHIFDRWTTASLWPPATPQRIPYSQSITEIVFTSLFLLWWGAVRRFPEAMFGANPAGFGLSPVWRSLGPILVVMVLVLITRSCINLVKPDWIRFHSTIRFVTDVAAIVILAVLLNADTLVVVTRPDYTATLDQLVKMGDRTLTVMQVIDYSIRFSLLITAVIYAIDAAIAIRRLMRAASN